MGAFISLGEVGVWVSNGERDAFLDWFAAHRCAPHDARWEYFQLKDRRRIIVRRGMGELQWSTFLRGIHDAFQDDIIQKV